MQPPSQGPWRGYQQPPKDRSDLATVLLVLAVILFVGLFMGFYTWAQKAKKTPIANRKGPLPDPQGALKLRDLGDGWATYRFPDLKLDLDLPAPPAFGARQADQDLAPYIRQDLSFTITSDRLSIGIRRIWYKALFEGNANQLADETERAVAQQHPGASHSSRQNTTFGDVPAIQQEFLNPDPKGATILDTLCAANRTGTIEFTVTSWAQQRSEASAAWKRILSSMRPSDPGLPRDHLMSDILIAANLPGGVSKVKGGDMGWATYRFADLKLDMELPSEPTLSPGERADRRIQEVDYDANTDDCLIEIRRLWYRDAEPPTLDSLVRSTNDMYASEASAEKLVSRQDSRFGDAEAVEEEFQHQTAQGPGVMKLMLCADSSGAFEVMARFLDRKRESGEAALQHVMSSMKPSDSTMPEDHLIGASD